MALLDLPPPLVAAIVLAMFAFVLWWTAKQSARRIRRTRPEHQWTITLSMGPSLWLGRRPYGALGGGIVLVAIGFALVRSEGMVLGGAMWLAGALTLLLTAQGILLRRELAKLPLEAVAPPPRIDMRRRLGIALSISGAWGIATTAWQQLAGASTPPGLPYIWWALMAYAAAMGAGGIVLLTRRRAPATAR